MSQTLASAADRRWVSRYDARPDDGAVADLARELKLPTALCRLLVLRGHREAAAAKRFLRPTLEDLHDPLALAGISEAVARLELALERGETILVHGDYDVDGMCAAALYTRVLRELGGSVVPFVPHRTRDGYDLGAGGIAAAREAGARLILTGDCGVLAHAAAAEAAGHGIHLIVTDHHSPGSTLPDCVAVVNPNRVDCAYPEKGLSGTGIAFKVCQVLCERRGVDPEWMLYHLDLVALATVADLSPLAGENRGLVHFGLRVLPRTRNPGIAALLKKTGLDGEPRLTAGQLGHVLGPRLNAVGRLEDAGDGLRLLLTDSAEEAERLAARLEDVNARRRAVDRRTLADALEILKTDYAPEHDRAVVLAGRGWHPGVIGIVASRVVERLHRPAVLIAMPEDGGHGRGSARSVRGFDLIGALRECEEHLERLGGHEQAAGFDIRPDRIDQFRAAFGSVARERLGTADLQPLTRYDTEITLPEATREFCGYLNHLGPFGIGNPTPVFIARGVGLARAPRVVGENHLRVELTQEGTRMGGIGFQMADRIADFADSGEGLTVAFQLRENRWKGRTRVEAKLVDVAPSSRVPCP